MDIEFKLKKTVLEAIEKLYRQTVDEKSVQIQKTRKDFEGDFTLVVFPLLRVSKKPPEQTAEEIGNYLKENVSEIHEYNVIKGFLNLSFDKSFWISYLESVAQDDHFGFISNKENPKTILIEYSSPNTNKPLHLGHVRNNLLGYSVAKLLETQGDKVYKVNLVNDRGIHICKSMLAWQKWGDINSYLDWCINNTDEIVEKIRTLVKQNIFNYCKRIVLSYKNGNIGRSIDENYKQEVIGLYEKTKSNKNPINQLVNILENHEIYLKDSKNYKLLKRRIDKQKRELEFRNEKIEPKTSGKKGDHLVGDFYVKFDQEYKKQIGSLISEGLTEDEAKQTAPLILEAQKMLIDWEAGDKKTRELWKKMNSWVLEGFDVTYKKLGVDFDKVYFESDTYKLGKKLVLEGLEKGMFFKKEDGSVWADLTDEGLDQKILLRSDGTSVYMTQDLGTAHQRFSDYNATEAIYVVGNEQNYHFQVLKIVLAKLGFEWAENLYHLSYGMVELPEGKMKSREGTVVDADDLLEEMTRTADEMSRELGKLDDFSNEERKKIIETIGLGALKYFILKVDPKKTMTFDPKESIDFNGNTGPFIQYTYARIQSLIKKAHSNGLDIPVGLNSKINISGKELQLIKLIHTYPEVLAEAATDYSPAQIANYIYDLAKEFNQFYHDHPILSESNRSISEFRLYLSKEVSKIIKSSMGLLGIQVPERM